MPLSAPPPADEEQLAMGAMDFLERAPATDPAATEHARKVLGDYRAKRIERGLPLFPKARAEADKERVRFLKNLHTKPLEDFLPAADLERVNLAAGFSDDPDAFKQGEANKAFLSAVTGQPMEGATYELYRDAYAREHLKLSGPVTEAAFYAAMKERHAEDDAAAAAIQTLAAERFRGILSGDANAFVVDAAKLQGLPPARQLAVRQAVWSAGQEALDIRRRLQPVLDSVRGYVDFINAQPAGAGETRESRIRNFIVEMANDLPDDPLEQEFALAMIAGELGKAKADGRPGILRVLEGIEQGMNTAAEGARYLGAATVRRVLAPVEGTVFEHGVLGELKETSEDRMAVATKVKRLKDVLRSGVFSLKNAQDSLALRASVAAAPSIPYTAMALTPYGMPAMAATMAGQSMQDAAIQYPDADPNAQYLAGLVSGSVQAGLETVFTRVGLKLATGRIPTLTNLLNRAGVASVSGRVALGAPLAAAAATGTEYTEEIGQDFTDKLLQGLAADFSGVAPDFQWGKFFTDWVPGNSEQSRETLLAILPFAVLAGGVAGVKHVRNGRFYLKHAALHDAAGFTADESKAIFAATTDEQAQQAVQAAFAAAQQRAATLTPEQEAELAAKRAAALETLRTQARLLQDAGLPVVSTEYNDFTDSDQYYFTDPSTGERQEFASEDEALHAFEAWHAQLPFDALATLETAAKPDWISHLTAEGQANEETEVEDTGRPANLGLELSAAEKELKAAEKAALTGTTAAARRDAETRADNARDIIRRVRSRFELFLIDNNLVPGSLAISDLAVRAKSVAQMVGNRIVGWTVQLFEGHTIQDVTEDMSETMLKRGIADNLLSPYQIQEDIRAYESATGRALLPAGYDYTPENAMPLVEAFSKLARGFMFAHARHAEMPETVRRWVEMTTAIAAATVDAAKSTAAGVLADVAVAADIRAAMESGALPARLRERLADSIGLNPQETEARLRARMEAQLAAEAHEGFPEITETLRGRLPHPATMTDKGMPFAGEVRRLWECLVRPTRRRTKGGKEVDRTNEANAYFLPIGQVEDLDQVRRVVNQEGFAFDTPAEMLEALEMSLAYGKPQYGVGSPDFGQPSFAVSLPVDKAEVADYLSSNGTPTGVVSEESERISAALESNQSRHLGEGGIDYREADLFGPQPGSDPAPAPRAKRAAANSKVGTDPHAVSDDLKAGLAGDWEALAREVAAKGRASSLLPALIRREIPQWNVNGSRIESPADVHALMLPIRSPYFESLKVMIVDGNRKVVHSQILTVGSINESTAPVGEILGVLARLRETTGRKFTSLILSHNHPSGHVTPSRADEMVTRRLNDAARMAGWNVLDHIVTNGESYFSFAEAGFMNGPAAGAEREYTPRKDDGVPVPPIRDEDRQAPWEAVKRGVLKILDGPQPISDAARHLRNANPDAAHILYLTTRLSLLAVERIDRATLTGKAALSRALLAGIGREGAAAIALDIPHDIATDTNQALSLRINVQEFTRTAGLRVVDIISLDGASNYNSWTEQGIISEDRAEYHAGASYAVFPRPFYGSDKVSDLRTDKSAWKESGYGMAGAMEIVAKYYKTAAFAGIPRNAVLVPVPSTKGHNVLPLALAYRLRGDFGNDIEARPAGVAVAATEAKDKRTFLQKLAEPVIFDPVPETIAALQGRKVVVTEDVHNTGESWISFVRMLQANGVTVAAVAALTSTEQRMTSARDVERIAEKIAALTKTPLDEARQHLHSLLDGTFKQLANKAEKDAGSAKGAAAVLAHAVSGKLAGVYANPLQDRNKGSGGSGGVDGEAGGLSQGQFSFALSLKGLLTLDQTLVRLASQGPAERAEYYEKLRNRLAALTLIARDAKRNNLPDASDAETLRARIRDSLAEANAIRDALPMEARARLRFSLADLVDKDTESGAIKALIRLVADADEALETALVNEYREAIEKLLDLAKPDLRPNKQLRGRLTPETQKVVGKILGVVELDADRHFAEVSKVEQAIDDLNNETPATPERAAAIAEEIADLSETLDLLTTFGPFSKLEASGLAHALRALERVYTTGRTQRRILDEADKAEIEAARREVVASNSAVNHTRHAIGKAKPGWMANLMLGLSSFHQVMEYFFPNSLTARFLQERVREADRDFTWDKIHLRERYDAFTFAAWNLSGPSRLRRRNQIVFELSQIKTDWGIEIREGVATEEISLDEDQAAAILAGTLKPGWEGDMITMQALGDALVDFRMQRLKAQAEARAFNTRVIRFRRVKSRGTPADYTASPLAAAYLLQMWAQPQYRPALDRYGFTEEVMGKIEAALDPRANDLLEWMRQEYDEEWERLNPVYRAIYHMDMPKIRNYAPGVFEHMDAKSGSDAGTLTPEGGAPGVNAMSAGFTKARQHHMARPDDQNNALQQFFAHFEAANYFVRYAEIVRDVRRVFRHPEVRRQMNGLHGQKNTMLFHDWLDAIELDGRFRQKEVAFMSRLGSRMLAARAMTGLAFNIGVLFKQASAATGFLMEMPTKRALAGLWQAITRPGEYRAAVTVMWNHEAIRQRLLAGVSPEDRQVLDAAADAPSRVVEWLNAGRVPIAYTDAALTTLSSAVAFTEARNAALAAKLTADQAEQAGLAAAVRVIERTAQPATTQDKSMVELHPSFVMRLLTQFKSDPRQKLAIVANAISGYRAGRVGKAELARKIVFSWAVYGWMNAAMADLATSIFRDDDDPDKWTWADYLACSLAGPLSSVPVLGAVLVNMLGSIGVLAGGKQKPFSSSASPMEDGLDRLPSAAKKAGRLWDNLTDIDPTNTPTVNEVLTTMQQFAAASAALTGSAAAALPAALLRLARDIEGAGANVVDMLTASPDDDRLRIVREVAEEKKAARGSGPSEAEEIAKELLALPATQRAGKLEKLPTRTRSAVRRHIKRAEMTASEAALSRLSADARATAIERILPTVPASERDTYLARLRSLGLAE